jgi:phosphoglycerate dehydrogenase-like enzyme
LASLKQFSEFHLAQLNDTWERKPVTMLADARVLLLGYGSIAKAVEERLQPFGAVITRVARNARPGVHPAAELAVLLPQTDIVVVLLPLTAETNQVVDEEFLRQLPDGALLVNVARGRVVDTDALLRELQRGRLRAVLDVTDPEPLPAGHPLYHAPGVFITPHVSWWTADGMRRNYEVVATQLRKFARGEQLENIVTDGY